MFVYGFAKNDRDNLTPEETVLYRKLAKEYLKLKPEEFNRLAEARQWKEVYCDDENL